MASIRGCGYFLVIRSRERERADILQALSNSEPVRARFGLACLADALQPVVGIPGRQSLRSLLISALDIPHTRLLVGQSNF